MSIFKEKLKQLMPSPLDCAKAFLHPLVVSPYFHLDEPAAPLLLTETLHFSLANHRGVCTPIRKSSLFVLIAFSHFLIIPSYIYLMKTAINTSLNFGFEYNF